MSVHERQASTKKFEAQISNLKREVKLWEEKYERLEEDHELLQLATENVLDLDVEVKDLRSPVKPIHGASIIPQKRLAPEDTVNKIGQLNNENLNLKQELDDLQNAKHEVRMKTRETISLWEKRYQGLQNDLDHATLSTENVAELRAHLAQGMSQLNDQNHTLKQELNDFQKSTARYSTENIAELQAKLDVLDFENDELEVEKQTLDAEKKRLTSENANQASEVSHLRAELLQADSIAAKVLHHLYLFSECPDVLQSRKELEAAHTNISFPQASLSSLVNQTSEASRLRAQLQQADSIAAKKRKELETAHAEISSLNASLNSLHVQVADLLQVKDNQLQASRLVGSPERAH
ncbi:hypothetical protein C8R43DRAFT_964647 [Mycena crocata]|nr:hypothetical protein C8R43DRAFT_964647 [Mycena crocata]